jgi:NAD-dependent dihydropyrimidine dehydrogenase PreA subunit
MAYIITKPCIGVKDGACVVVCPMDCIHPQPGSPDVDTTDQLFIDPGECIDCGICVAECPVNAIFYEADLPTEWASFVEKNAAHFLPKEKV